MRSTSGAEAATMRLRQRHGPDGKGRILLCEAVLKTLPQGGASGPGGVRLQRADILAADFPWRYALPHTAGARYQPRNFLRHEKLNRERGSGHFLES